jgi:hypothetical protein
MKESTSTDMNGNNVGHGEWIREAKREADCDSEESI